MDDDRVQAVLQRWPVVLATLLVVVVAALATGGRQTDQPVTRFEATHLLYNGGTDDSPGAIPLETLALLATVGEVPAEAASRLGLDIEPAVLASQVRITADSRLGTLTVATRDTDPEEAVARADAYAEAILDFVGARAAERRADAIAAATDQVDRQEARIAELEAELLGLPPESAQAGLVRAERDGLIRQYGLTLQELSTLNNPATAEGNLYSLQSATPIPVQDEQFISAPTGLVTRVLIAVALGLGIGLAIALLLDRLDTSVRTRKDAERAFGLPVVTEVPQIPRAVLRRGPVIEVEPASHAAEAYRLLRTALQLMPRWILSKSITATSDDGTPAGATPMEGPVELVLVTSAEPAQGKSTTAIDLALSFVELGLSVVLVDCDYRHANLHDRMGLRAGPGVREYEPGRNGIGDNMSAILQESGIRDLKVATAGTQEPTGSLPAITSAFLRALRGISDIVIVDSGPLLTVNDTATLVPMVDAVVLTARSGDADVDAARRTRDMLARLEAHVLGVVLTAVPRTLLSQRPSARYYGTAPKLVTRTGKADKESRKDSSAKGQRTTAPRPKGTRAARHASTRDRRTRRWTIGGRS